MTFISPTMKHRLTEACLAVALGAPGCRAGLADGAELGTDESALLASGFADTPTTQVYPVRPEDFTVFQFKLVDVNGDGTPDLVQESPGGAPGSTVRSAFGT